MFLIRRIHDDLLPVNKEAIRQVEDLFRQNFSAVRPEEIAGLTEKLRNPFKQQYRSVLYVAERQRTRVVGFGLLMHEPVLEFCYLDFMASARELKGRGVGGAIYHYVRQEAKTLGAKGLFFECLPDDPQQCDDEAQLAENVARLRFYERFGARPVVGTAYQMPIKEGQRGLPYLVFDALDRGEPLGRDFARKVVRAVLERNYGYLCPPEYVRIVIDSFRDDLVQIRPPRYVRQAKPIKLPVVDSSEPIAMVVNDKHDIHHVRERGYVESPVRIKSILAELEPTGMFRRIAPRSFPVSVIRAVHDADFVGYLQKACASVAHGKSVYPYVFPIRNVARPPKELSVRAGYYCIDTFTPLNPNAYLAAKRAVDCTLTAADEILFGRRLAYALVRPPGHHAERRAFGGFCYFNNNAIAAQYFSRYGKVAIVDVDYHHGNGQENIFYQRSDVFTVSIHGHPNFAYPYFTGFSDARGEGPGEGFNLNLPQPESLDGPHYRVALERALKAVVKFRPDFLIVALGLDTAKGDPTGTWSLGAKDFEANGRMLAELSLPTLVVQEGGYRTRTLGTNARRFFAGLHGTQARGGRRSTKSEIRNPKQIPMSNVQNPERAALRLSFREEITPGDRAAVRAAVESTGFFSAAEVEVALELVDERLAKGAASGYHFVLADAAGRMLGFACYGPIPATAASFDLYWIVVHKPHHGEGVGRALLAESERLVLASGGRRVYVDTSSRPQYAPTRAFYERNGYQRAAVLDDFYAPGDGKVIYVKVLEGSRR